MVPFSFSAILQFPLFQSELNILIILLCPDDWAASFSPVSVPHHMAVRTYSGKLVAKKSNRRAHVERMFCVGERVSSSVDLILLALKRRDGVRR
jgi:hypothetical protein